MGIVQGLIGLSTCQRHLQLKRLGSLSSYLFISTPTPTPSIAVTTFIPCPRELSKYNHCYRDSGLAVWECCQRVAIDVILKGLYLCLFRSCLMHINVNINVNICASNDRRKAVDGFVSVRRLMCLMSRAANDIVTVIDSIFRN